MSFETGLVGGHPDRERLQALLEALDAPQSRFTRLEAHYAGRAPLSYVAPEARAALEGRWDVLGTNLPRLVVTSLAERLRVTGFTGDHGTQAWDVWARNDLDQWSGSMHREALTLGVGYAIVWADTAGKARVSVEPASMVSHLTDPFSGVVTSAIKRWSHARGTTAIVYLPDELQTWEARSTHPTMSGFEKVYAVPNPLGVVPVVPMVNTERLDGIGVSELTDVAPLADALAKTLSDLLVGSEYAARPRRWATGIELEEDPDTGLAVNPFGESHRMMISESEGSKFGQLPGSDLGGYESVVKVLISQIMAVSSLPAHYVGVLSNQPASADALRAAEAGLVARVEARQQVFGKAWEQIIRLAVAVEKHTTPTGVDAQVVWADPATRSVAQEADSVVKLFQSGLLPASYALARLGYNAEEIALINQARERDAAADVDLSAVLGGGS